MATSRFQHTSSGKVHSVTPHTDGRHVVVSVAHKAPRGTKSKDGKRFGMSALSHSFPDRQSSFLVPKSHAHHFPVGEPVSMAIGPSASTTSTDDGDLDGDDGDNEQNESPAVEASEQGSAVASQLAAGRANAKAKRGKAKGKGKGKGKRVFGARRPSAPSAITDAFLGGK